MDFSSNEFKIEKHGLDKENMRINESIMSIGNEYMGMRGNFEETYSGDSLQGVYLGGVWYPDKTRVGWWKNGYPKYFGKMINSPNYVGIKVTINGKELDLNEEDVKSFDWTLDIKEGVLYRNFVIKRGNDEFEIKVQRFVSIDVKELCAIKYEIKSLKGDANVEFVPYIDGRVKNEDSNYEELFWNALDKGIKGDKGYLISKTIENNFGIERFSVCNYMKNNASGKAIGKIEEKDLVGIVYEDSIKEGETAFIEKLIITTSTRDYKENELLKKSEDLMEKVSKEGYEALLKKQIKKWKNRWEIADVVIKNNPKQQEGIRYNIFQLFSTYYGDDYRLNVGPKGFTGEKYGGATYWDTEAYILPMYLSIAPTSVSRNLLMYRFKQLKEAYHNAKEQGLKGALYPMVTFNGIECHNEWEITFEEIHRNGAIAHAIYNYSRYTGDGEYLLNYGIDVLIGIARFWADRVHYSKRNDKYMIHGVTGPNEFENNVNNNWYTNTLAAFVLKYTHSVLNKEEFKNLNLEGEDKKNLDKKIKAKIDEYGISDEELKKWDEIVEKMYYPYDKELGIFVQNDTYLDKELIPVSKLTENDRPLTKHWSWDKILRSCYIKQADVLQGIYFFDDQYTKEEKKKNFDFYEPYTVHESSLSACIHAIIACEIGEVEKAVKLYERTSRLDLDNYNKDTCDGLHITSMSGAWLSVVQGFAGMRTLSGQLSFNPIVPNEWDGYTFHINYRERLIKVDTTNDKVKITLVKGDKLNLKIYGKEYLLEDKIEENLKKCD